MNGATLGYIAMGVAIGVVFGAIPGLSSVTAMVLLLPFIWGGDPLNGSVILLSVVGAVHCSNTFPAVFFNIPGSPSASATILDGYPLAKKGEAARALAAAFFVSAVGGIFGALILAVIIPVVRPLVLKFASPEVFMLIMLGVVMIGILSGPDPIKGILSGAIGLLASLIGMDPQTGIPRYVFGQAYLLYGLALLPVIMGLFALPQVMELAKRGRIADIPPKEGGGRHVAGVKQGIKDAIHHWRIVLRSSSIGVLGGAIPGLGGTAAAFYAYADALRSAKNKETFGKGDIRGVIAPESANNATQGGELIPTLAFGIPGSPTAAVLLAAFLVLGIVPGSPMLTTRITLTFSLVWCIVISNVLAAAICLSLIRVVARMAWIRGNLLIPFVLLFCIVGSYIEQATLSDFFVTLAFGVLGYVMMKYQWPRVPLLIGFVLGSRAENTFFISVESHGPFFFLRPISFVILLLLVTVFIFSLWRRKANR